MRGHSAAEVYMMSAESATQKQHLTCAYLRPTTLHTQYGDIKILYSYSGVNTPVSFYKITHLPLTKQSMCYYIVRQYYGKQPNNESPV